MLYGTFFYAQNGDDVELIYRLSSVFFGQKHCILSMAMFCIRINCGSAAGQQETLLQEGWMCHSTWWKHIHYPQQLFSASFPTVLNISCAVEIWPIRREFQGLLNKVLVFFSQDHFSRKCLKQWSFNFIIILKERYEEYVDEKVCSG